MRLNYDPEGDHSLTGFDRFGRVVDQLWEQYDPSAEEWLPIDRYHYGYDAAGNRVWKMNAVAHDLSLPLDELYEYDELARLVAARRGLLSTSPSLSLASVGFEQAWGLDGLGNFATFQEDSDGQGWDLDQERDVNAANEITGIDEGQGQAAWRAPQYDAAGNMIVGPAPGDETARLHFVYDAWNRLVKVYADDAQNPGEPGDVVVEYTYDGQKRRIEKALADGTSIESYYNANWQLLEERFLDESQEPTGADQYVWSPRYIDSPVLRDRYDDEGELDAAARLYYLGDANFNVTALVGLDDEEWTVTERYAYDPYGKAVVYDADWDNPTAPTAAGPLYAGYRFDAETGLYIARHRLYHSTLATWTTRDPIGYAAADANLYRYVANDPCDSLDPDGLAQKRLWVELAKGWKFGIDRGPEMASQGGFEIHVYKGSDEVAKVTGFGGWCKSHGGKPFKMTPSQFKTQHPEVHRELQLQLRSQATHSAKQGWRPNRIVSGARARIVGGALAAFSIGASASAALDTVAKNGNFQKLMASLEQGDLMTADFYAGNVYHDLLLGAGNAYWALGWQRAWDEAKTLAHQTEDQVRNELGVEDAP